MSSAPSEAAKSEPPTPPPPTPPRADGAGAPASSSSEKLQFSVKYASLSLKITLDAKWQAKPLLLSVVKPFVLSHNKKRPAEEAISEEALLGMQADDSQWVDPSGTAAALPPAVAQLALHFDGKAALATRACRVTHGEVTLHIKIEPKWLRQPFAAAVVSPFVLAYNKKLVPEPLAAAAFSGADVDGAQLSAADARKPTCLLVADGTKVIELAFGSDRAAAAGSEAAAAGTSAGGTDPSMPPHHPERQRQFWSRVNSSAEALAAKSEVRWSNLRLAPADGAVMAVALASAARVRCEGSYHEGLGNLLILNLASNDLRCEGIEHLAPVLLDGDTLMVALRELYLMDNRIGDRGVGLLARLQLPHLKILSLQDNAIGGEGMLTLARAITAKTFSVRHLNVLDNRCGLGSEMEALQEAVRGVYMELKAPRVATAKEVMKGAR